MPGGEVPAVVNSIEPFLF